MFRRLVDRLKAAVGRENPTPATAVHPEAIVHWAAKLRGEASTLRDDSKDLQEKYQSVPTRKARSPRKPTAKTIPAGQAKSSSPSAKTSSKSAGNPADKSSSKKPSSEAPKAKTSSKAAAKTKSASKEKAAGQARGSAQPKAKAKN